jgi:predicted DNA-binding protein YlxM (UPF0122 family)
MRRPTDDIVVLDSYTMEEKARFSSVNEIIEKFGVNRKTVYGALSRCEAAYDCYWVYAKKLSVFKPKKIAYRRTKGIKILEQLNNRVL